MPVQTRGFGDVQPSYGHADGMARQIYDMNLVLALGREGCIIVLTDLHDLAVAESIRQVHLQAAGYSPEICGAEATAIVTLFSLGCCECQRLTPDRVEHGNA